VLRTVFITALLVLGWGFALQGPLYAAALYLWIAYFRPEAWAWSDVFKTLDLSYYAGAYLVFRTIFSPARFTFSFRSLLMFLFLGYALLSTALSPHAAYAFPYWEAFAKTIVVSYLLTVVITTPSEFRLILIVIALSLGFEGAKQGWAQLILNPGVENTNGIPFLGDNNLVAVGMMMLLPVTAALGRTASTRRGRLFFYLLSIGVLYRAVSTYSRGGFLACAAVGLMYWWRSPFKLRTAIAGLLAIAIVLPALPPAFWTRMSTIMAKGDNRDASTLGRLHFWNVAVSMANDHPLLGVGFNAYQAAYDDYDSSEGEFGISRSVHSAWLGVLAEMGYPGLVLYLSIVVLSFSACHRVRRQAARGDITSEFGRYAVGLEAALVAFVVGGSLVPFQYYEMLWHFFALTMALEAVAVAEASTVRARATVVADPERPAPSFVWGPTAATR
jgi:probable O-glycosylation ligase (exosortase A-associated)